MEAHVTEVSISRLALALEPVVKHRAATDVAVELEAAMVVAAAAVEGVTASLSAALTTSLLQSNAAITHAYSVLVAHTVAAITASVGEAWWGELAAAATVRSVRADGRSTSALALLRRFTVRRPDGTYRGAATATSTGALQALAVAANGGGPEEVQESDIAAWRELVKEWDEPLPPVLADVAAAYGGPPLMAEARRTATAAAATAPADAAPTGLGLGLMDDVPAAAPAAAAAAADSPMAAAIGMLARSPGRPRSRGKPVRKGSRPPLAGAAAAATAARAARLGRPRGRPPSAATLAAARAAAATSTHTPYAPVPASVHPYGAAGTSMFGATAFPSAAATAAGAAAAAAAAAGDDDLGDDERALLAELGGDDGGGDYLDDADEGAGQYADDGGGGDGGLGLGIDDI